jgi:hypothetical protein
MTPDSISDGQIRVLVWTSLGLLTVVIYAAGLRHRRHAAATDLRLCRGCATPHPAIARFCRRCGRPL